MHSDPLKVRLEPSNDQSHTISSC